MGYVFDYYTDLGGREKNEDDLCALEKDGALLFAVADGLGGHGSGEIASGITVAELTRRFDDDPLAFDLREAILSANSLILDKQEETGVKMRSTVVAVLIRDGKAVVANAGDSRAYFFLGDELAFQTTDHSVSQMAVQVGEITQDQIRGHEDRNILTRALGSTRNLKVDVARLNDSAFDRILLCSDGFWEYVMDDELRIPRKSPEEWLRAALRLLAGRAPENNDNNTAIAVMKKG